MIKKKSAPASAPIDVGMVIEAIRVLRGNHFASLNHAQVFFELAGAQMEEAEIDLTRLRSICAMPFSTISRILWDLHELGLVEYSHDPGDRRRRLLRAATENLA
jgi:DNA-binding MarR family transcriptional regulator